MDFDFNLERIENGWIVTGNDSTRLKTFYPSLKAMIEVLVMSRTEELDKYYREHQTHGNTATLTVGFSDSTK